MKRFRMDAWAYIAVALGAVIVIIAPQQISVTAYKLSLLAAGIAAVW